MKSLKKTNMFLHLVSARGNRPNEVNVPVPSKIVDSFLQELADVETNNDTELHNLTLTNNTLLAEKNRLKEELDLLKAQIAGQ